MKYTRSILSFVSLVGLVTGCAAIFQPKTVSPVPFRVFGNADNPTHICILLPGIRDRIDTFEKHDFTEIAAPLLSRNPNTALITVDAHWGYYRERIIVERLGSDILERYPEARITLVGASLGGFGALLTTLDFSERVERLVLLAPLLGEDDYQYLNRIRDRGFTDMPDDEELTLALNRVWKFLLDDNRQVPILIGYGADDSFTPYYRHLISQNPPLVDIREIPGGHDWTTWKRLWTGYAEIALRYGAD